jgi:hypothetical protein
MDNDQAKLILSAYRPGGEDAADPFFEEALAQARKDPALAAWLEDQRRFDREMSALLHVEVPPAGLREGLRTGAHAARVNRPVQEAGGWRARLLVTAAAAVVVATGFWWAGQRGQPSMTGEVFAEEVIALKSRGGFSLARMGGSVAEYRDWFEKQGAPHDFVLPVRIQGLKSLGCQTYEIQGRTVSLVCFLVDERRMVHVFTINSRDLRDPPGPQPRMVRRERNGRDYIAATWSSGGRTYVVIGTDLDEAGLRRLI